MTADTVGGSDSGLSPESPGSSGGGSGFQVLAFSIMMFFGAYVSGSLPLFVSLSEDKLHKVSVLGAGLLLGTALAVIVPEGVQTLFLAAKSSSSHHSHKHHGEEGHDEIEGLDKDIGVALVLGFLFMLLIDQIASYSIANSSSNQDSESGIRTVKQSVSWTTTLGLVVHAAADGIALGAAATTRHTDIEIIVFAAIMLHKAPASFGLVTFLLQSGLERNRIRKHLMAFSLAAPALAIFTYTALNASGSSADSKDSTLHATGVAMLFSAGTFLYVATVHVLPEIMMKGDPHPPSPSSHSHNHSSGFSKMDLFLIVVGALLPLLLTLGHHH